MGGVLKLLQKKTIRICAIPEQFHKNELPVHWFSTENQGYPGLTERTESQLLPSQHTAIQATLVQLLCKGTAVKIRLQLGQAQAQTADILGHSKCQCSLLQLICQRIHPPSGTGLIQGLSLKKLPEAWLLCTVMSDHWKVRSPGNSSTVRPQGQFGMKVIRSPEASYSNLKPRKLETTAARRFMSLD